MPSETPRLDRLTAELVDSLATTLPASWSIRDAEAKPERALRTVLYYELGDLVTEHAGTPFPKGILGATVTLTLTAPEAEPVKGTARVQEEVLRLVPVLDGIRTLHWDRAEKIRLQTGETGYRLEVIHLTRYTPTRTTPAPATTPDNIEE